ncbi:hypothetical protein [Prochlorothrix hollandica]|uniref:Uncharacterized protein n=1 Tax=Prochlorothrix hollandica PCC 9006 = CALU 1027 TaxID=317619 RepID=A0A0M2Q140_PROHO|nr:hypothetical protein [Prochlorothrix hollandica]KKJ01023.1 hypothetical protein PROH_00925 [Prochlorothrix hollandica PCC 9006 = CALU 1027]
MAYALPLPGAIAALYAQANATDELTLADRYALQAALLSGQMDEEEQQCINRILYSVRRGRVHISNKISALS